MASVEALEAQEIPPKVGEWLDKTRHPTIKKRFLMFEHEYKDSGGAWTYTDWRRHQSWSRYESRTRLRWRVASGEWRVASGEWRVASGVWRPTDSLTHSCLLQLFRRHLLPEALARQRVAGASFDRICTPPDIIRSSVRVLDSRDRTP